MGSTVRSHTVLYRRGEPSSELTLVLQGRAVVWAGSESFQSEIAPWSCIGNNALLHGDYCPDFTAVTTGACRLLQVSRYVPSHPDASLVQCIRAWGKVCQSRPRPRTSCIALKYIPVACSLSSLSSSLLILCPKHAMSYFCLGTRWPREIVHVCLEHRCIAVFCYSNTPEGSKKRITRSEWNLGLQARL